MIWTGAGPHSEAGHGRRVTGPGPSQSLPLANLVNGRRETLAAGL